MIFAEVIRNIELSLELTDALFTIVGERHGAEL
jgi:hypothetical protein